MKVKKILILLALCFTTVAFAAEQQPTPTPPPVIDKPVIPNFPEEAHHIEAPSFEGAFVKMLVSLGGLIVLVAGTIWVLRRMSQGRFGGKVVHDASITILEKRPLSPKSMLYLVQVGQKQVLIAESQLEVRALTSFDDLPEGEEELED